VLHLTSVPFRPEEGVSRAVIALAANLGSDVENHLGAADPVGEEFDGLHRLPHWKPGRLLASGALDEVVRSVDPDIVHLHGGILISSLALSPSLRNRTVVATIYQLLPVPWSELGPRNLRDARRSSLRLGRIAASAMFGLRLTRRLLRTGRIASICTPDPRVAAALGDCGPVTMARGGASISHRRASWSDSPVVGFAGRAEPGRGVEALIAAVRLVRVEMPTLRLRLLLLPGPAAERWQKIYGNEPGLELAVGIQGDLAEQLAACQVVALPFRIPATITPPLVAAEAMAVGVPVVANDLSCISPLVRSDVNGMLAADATTEALADALRRVLCDRETWERLSDGALRTIANEWSWQGAAEATRRSYAVAATRSVSAALASPAPVDA
jgi:alpha-maltose-1-phosphate synthase